MDHETLKLLAKVKVVARKTMGLDIDIQRLTHEPQYAAEMLAKAMHSDNEDLVLAAITLQDRFGMLKPRAPEPREPAELTEKYVFGARG
jgi:hypothetical protein